MPIKAKTLFEVVFRSLVEGRKAQAGSVDAYVMFTIFGDEEGIWTFDLRKDGAHDVLVGKVEDPGLHIMLASDFLDQFLTGNFDVEDAIQKDKLGIRGEKRVFDAFATFLIGQPFAGAGKAAKAGTGLSEPPKSAGVGLRK